MSYENPVTYVDTESSKILANAISGIGQATSKIISDDIAKKAKIAEENKIENKKRAQAFKRYQIAGQENVNEATKDLDFTGNESFRNATSGIIDKLAKAKSDYEFSTDPEESKRLSKEIYELDSFLKNGFTGQMDDLMREIMNNPGVEGGLDQFQDSNYTTMLTAMANGDDPGEMTFEIIDGKIEMTLKGDMYNRYRQDDTKGIYKVDLKANQSTEVARIPVFNMRTPTQKGGKSVLQTAGVIDDQGQIPIDSFSEEIGESKDLANNTTLFKYKINEETENKIISAVEMEVAGLLKGGEGLAGGFTGADSYYRNILLTDDEANGNVEGVMPFLETGSYEVTDDKGNVKYVVPITEESYKALVDRISKREIDYVNSQMKPQTRATVSAPTGGRGTEKERKEREDLDNFARTESISIASGSGITELYDQVKSNTSTYDYDPGTGFTSGVRSEKDYKEDIASLTPQELHEQGLIATFTESERKNPYQQNSNKFKSTIQDKIDNYLATLGDSEDKFVNFNDGSAMNEKDALVALFKSTPKYKDLKPSQIEKLVVEALKKRPEKESNEFEEDISRFQTDNISDVEDGEFSEEYASATEEIAGYSSPLFSRFRPDEVAKRKKERSKLVTKQKKDRKLLEDKYPNVSWPWEK
jgi:hypothetical protein